MHLNEEQNSEAHAKAKELDKKLGRKQTSEKIEVKLLLI